MEKTTRYYAILRLNYVFDIRTCMVESVFIFFLDCFNNRPRLARTNRFAVYTVNWLYVCGCAGKEKLVQIIEFMFADRNEFNFYCQSICNINYSFSGDAA